MLNTHPFDFIKMSPNPRGESNFIDKDFQSRYMLLLVASATLGLVLTIVPIYYFIDQNYQIFVDLAFEHSPELLVYLEQERFLMNTMLFGVFCGLLVFFGLISFRITERIIGPIKVLKNHLKLLTRGNWSHPPITIRDKDEFQDLVEAYNYFYKSYQKYIERDLERLARIEADPTSPDAQIALREIIGEKRAQSGELSKVLPHPTSNDAIDDQSPDSRHVS
jgi:HAMP domain-containing protein